MKPQTLTQKAKELVTQGANRNPTFKTLTDTQREQLTATAMRDAGKYADEFVIESGFVDALAGTIINALEVNDSDDRKELLMKLGEILLEGAIEHAQKSIDDALDNAITELAISRQFYHEGDTDYGMLIEDCAQRARDMNLANSAL